MYKPINSLNNGINNVNKYIQQIIESLDPIYTPKIKGRGVNTNFNNILNEQLYDLNYYSIMHYIIESEHIDETFIDVISDITNIYKSGNFETDKQIYTKWNYNIDTKECLNENNELLNIPIYVLFVEQESNVNAAISEREDVGNKIIITINKTNIDKHKNTYMFLYQCLTHEFLHAREMFALPNKNILQNLKNKLVDSNEENIFLWDKESKVMSNRYFNLAKQVIYMFRQSELRARLNSVNAKLNQIQKEDLPKSKREKIIYCFDKTQELSLYVDMLQLIDTLNVINNTAFSALEPIIYYCKKYKLTKTSLTNYSFNFRRPLSQYTKKEKLLIDAFIFELKHQLRVYKVQIEKVIYANLSKRQLI